MKQNTEVTDYFLQEIRKRLGARLKQVILFGSRARGDDVPDSDYDCLVILDGVSPAVKDAIDEVAGEVLYRYNIVLSIFPISEKKHHERIYEPFLMNIRKERRDHFMDEREELKEQLQRMVQKASRSLSAAKRHIEEGDYDFASSRAYYAAFYAVEAVLLTKHLAFSKHSGAIGAFNRQFVKTGVFPKDFSKLISRLFRERQTGDYEFDLSIEENDAREDVQIAESILQAI